MFHAFIHKSHQNKKYYVRRSLTPSQQRSTVEVAHTRRTIRQYAYYRATADLQNNLMVCLDIPVKVLSMCFIWL